MIQYDVIICGAGLSGRLVAYYLLKSDATLNILLIDKTKVQPDILYGYWESTAGEFEALVRSHFQILETIDNKGTNFNHLAKYTYKSLYRSALFEQIDQVIQPKAAFEVTEILALNEFPDYVEVDTRSGKFYAKKAYTSINLGRQRNKSLFINPQYFHGFEIESESGFKLPIFMDFSINASLQFRFGYVVPINKTRSLVHLVDYKRSPLRSELLDYIENDLQVKKYKIIRVERGRTILGVRVKQGNSRIIKIGANGGWINSATGYGLIDCINQAKKLANPSIELVGTPKNVFFNFLFDFMFAAMALLVNIWPQAARFLFSRINRIKNYDLVLDFVTKQGGILTIAKILSKLVA
jgi:hypothetical protein